MDVEGIGRLLSPEWLRATSTGIPILLSVWWLLELRAALWRRTLWQRLGGALRHLERQTGGRLVARGNGFSLLLDEGAVHWRGGLSGARTVVRQGTRRQTVPAWLTGEALDRLLDG